MAEKTANIEVPAVLKECLLSLTEVREKIQEYYPKSEVSDCVAYFADKCDDLIDDVVYQVGEMIRVEVIKFYHYKDK